jgi:organic radical activating enzyme
VCSVNCVSEGLVCLVLTVYLRFGVCSVNCVLESLVCVVLTVYLKAWCV